jgi:arylsulfatase A-like enzyme
MRQPLRVLCICALAFSCILIPASVNAVESARTPNILIITIDTLRPDRLSSYGYARRTSPNIDRLLEDGARFTGARTVEPLTTPALSSMITSLYPHEHGSSRNGLKIRPGLPSLSKILAQRGYRTAAFVGNWTLRDRLSGLSEHFDQFEEILTRKRWFGMVKNEATAEDLTSGTLRWLREHVRKKRQPFLVWVHYVEPHAPYLVYPEIASRFGIQKPKKASASDRYDMEIAFVDRWIGKLVAGIRKLSPPERTLTVFTADHGESLGEHDYWGHGANLYDPGLRIPMGIHWPGRIPRSIVQGPAVIFDIAPTLLGILGLKPPDSFRGIDWTPVIRGEAEPPMERITFYQTHKGAVQPVQNPEKARRNGLRELAVVQENSKKILRIDEGLFAMFDLAADPSERNNLVADKAVAENRLLQWRQVVEESLLAYEGTFSTALSLEDQEKLRALGYAQ